MCRSRGIRLLLSGSCLLLTTLAWAHPTGDQRLALLERQIAAEPQNALLYLARGDILRGNGDWAGALADYERASRHDLGLDRVDLARGLLHLEADRPADAEPFLRRFLSRQPGHGEALLAHARALVRLGRAREAVADYNRAIEQTSDAGADLYLERAEALLDAGAAAEALASLDEGLAVLGPLTVLQRRAVDIEIGMRRYDAALARLEILAGHSPLRERWLMRRGEVLELAGREDLAREAYSEAVTRIESRPANRRETQALKELKRELRVKLIRLTDGGGSGS